MPLCFSRSGSIRRWQRSVWLVRRTAVYTSRMTVQILLFLPEWVSFWPKRGWNPARWVFFYSKLDWQSPVKPDVIWMSLTLYARKKLPFTTQVRELYLWRQLGLISIYISQIRRNGGFRENAHRYLLSWLPVLHLVSLLDSCIFQIHTLKYAHKIKKYSQ